MKAKKKNSGKAKAAVKGSLRYKIGVVVFFIPFGMCVLSPFVVPLLGFSPSQSTALVAALMVLEEAVWLSSIPILGSDGFNYLKQKSFRFLMLPERVPTKQKFTTGVWLFCGGAAVQSLLHILILIAYVVYGAEPGQVILGMNFETQAAVYAILVALSTLSSVFGVYFLGTPFLEKMKSIFNYSDY